MGRRGREKRFHAPFAGLAAAAAQARPTHGEQGQPAHGEQRQTAHGEQRQTAHGEQRQTGTRLLAPRARDAQTRAAPIPQAADARADADVDVDAALFARAVQGIRPLAGAPERVAPPRAPRSAPSDEQLALAELEALVAGDGPFRVTDSEEAHTGLAPGVSYALLARLQRGEFAFHQHLDLHGMNRDTAHRALARFVTQARRDGERCVLVITGRGRSSPSGLAVLREALPRWLSRTPLRAHVLAFCSARPNDGGPGAFYLLLRRAGVRPFGTPLP